MSKVQTFEEWMTEERAKSDLDDVLTEEARYIWKAAHENAARVCEATGSDWPRNQWVETGADGCDACAIAIRIAIREAAQ